MSISDDSELEPEDAFWGQLDESDPPPADWAGDELEGAYLRALEALEASDAQFPELPPAPLNVTEADRSATTSDFNQSTSPSVADRLNPEEMVAELSKLLDAANDSASPSVKQVASIRPQQILEALLFVGGEPITTRKLSNVLRSEFSNEFIESQLDELNSLYSREGRPYEIRLGDGGYRISLREDYEKIRRKTYGLGPKEVKLSQEAIEVLAVIAYQQPVTSAGIEETKPGSASVLRQLLRRELIAVERLPDRPREVRYRTTPRFLSLFSIRSLNELPRLEQVVYK